MPWSVFHTLLSKHQPILNNNNRSLRFWLARSDLLSKYAYALLVKCPSHPSRKSWCGSHCHICPRVRFSLFFLTASLFNLIWFYNWQNWVYSVARCQIRRTAAITRQRTWYQLPCSLNGRSWLQTSNIPHQTCRICTVVINMYQYTSSWKSFHGLVCGEFSRTLSLHQAHNSSTFNAIG